MNSLRNSVRLIGNLGGNPEVKSVNNGRKLAKFSIATTDSYKNENGEKVTETQWHNLVIWGKPAETAERFLKKGSEIAVEGKLKTHNYTDKEGVKRYTTEVIVNDFMMVGPKKD